MLQPLLEQRDLAGGGDEGEEPRALGDGGREGGGDAAVLRLRRVRVHPSQPSRRGTRSAAA